MDCTTAMDSSSTTSERSSHASSPSSGPTPLMVKQQPLSPASNNNNNNTTSSMNHNPGSGSPQALPPPPSHHHSRHSPLSGPHPGVPGHHMGGGGMPHPLSPPPVGPRLAQSLQAHLPPPGLGLLGSLGVSGMLGHHGPLDLMAAHHGPPRSYNSPPPISSSDPTANECKLVEYRGQKVAAFIIAGDTMLCLPQAFELFLKHLVGGLHTVYTKLKRLDIVPLVCNVEQVRILRGLGAIQPGVNRCKLLSCKDFDILYRDCTTARCFTMKATECSRPGRPPKRAPVGLSLAASHLHHQQMKKHRLDNGDYPPPYENGHMDMSRMEKSPLLANGYNHPPHLSHMQFMQLPHPAAAHSALLSPGMPHGLGRPDGSVIKNQGMPPAMEAIARSGIWENCRAAYEDIVKHLERLREERGDVDRALALDQKVRDLSSHHGSPNGHSPVLNLSKSGGNGGGSLGSNDGDNDVDHSGSEADGPETALPIGEPHSPRSNPEDEEDENLSDPEEEDEKDQDMDDGADLPIPAIPNSDSQQALNYSTLASAVAASAGGGGGAQGPPDPSLSSTETLLRNIQGLLKVAADNARQQERQINYEKAELKMDVLREREVKDSLERQLGDEQKLRVLYQKRLRKERKVRRRIQDQLEIEMKRRTQLEDALKTTPAGAEALRLINENINNEQEQQKQKQQQSSQSGNSTSTSVDHSDPQSVNPQSQSQPPPRSSTESPPLPQGSQSHVSAQYVPCSTPNARDIRDPVTTMPNDAKPWSNYSGLDIMSSGAAFWQNYSDFYVPSRHVDFLCTSNVYPSESLAQELELERKSRQQQVENDVKSPLQDRANYYKNSVLFTSAT